MFLLATCFGQTIPESVGTFKGPMTLNKNTYQVEYDFLVVSKDTIKNGPIRFEKPLRFTEEPSEFDYQIVSGNFLLGYPSGDWMLKSGALKPSGDGFYRDYKYSYNVSGEEFLSLGFISNGAVSGSWKTLQLKIEESEIKDTLFYAQLTFPTDSLLGGFSVSKDQFFMSGSVDSLGFPNGSWQYFRKDKHIGHTLLSELVFDDGFLQRVIAYKNEEIYTIPIKAQETSESSIVEMEMSSTFFEIVGLIASAYSKEIAQSVQIILNPAELFMGVLNKNKKVDDILYDLIGIRISPVYKSKLIKFPYDSLELNTLSELVARHSDLNNIVNQIKNDPQITLTKQSTASIARLVGVVDTIDARIIHELGEFLALSERGVLEFVPRDEFVKANFSVLNRIDFNDTLRNQNGWSSFNFPHDTGEIELSNISDLSIYSEFLIDQVKQIKGELEEYVFEIEKEERLSALEELMIQKYTQTKLYIDSILSLEVDIIAGFDVSSMLVQFLEAELNDYSRNTSVESKMNQIEPLLACFDAIQDIARTISYVPSNKDIIQEAYTREVFNPYTFTNMEETLKQPIYKSFNQVILPRLFSNLNSLSCDKIEGFDKNFDKAFKGMIALLERDTRKEERKIRRITDAEKAAELLSFDLVFN